MTDEELAARYPSIAPYIGVLGSTWNRFLCSVCHVRAQRDDDFRPCEACAKEQP